MAINIPPNAVEMLFAEDLIKWLLRRHLVSHSEDENHSEYENLIVNIGKAERYRTFILNVFNADVRKAVNFIDTSIENEVDEQFSALEELNEKSFLAYALHHEKIYFKNDFLADSFLEYCVRVVSMAVKFKLFHVSEALNTSLHIILKLLEDRGMFTGGWDSVFEVAQKYAKIYEDCFNVITPESSDDENPSQNSVENPVQNSDKPPTNSSINGPPTYSSKNGPPTYSSKNGPPTHSSDDELHTNSSADSLYMNEENRVCDYVSNRSQLQKPGRELKTEDLTAARGDLELDQSSKSAVNANLNTEYPSTTRSVYKLLPCTSKRKQMLNKCENPDRNC